VFASCLSLIEFEYCLLARTKAVKEVRNETEARLHFGGWLVFFVVGVELIGCRRVRLLFGIQFTEGN
jgi:hypothetical protein